MTDAEYIERQHDLHAAMRDECPMPTGPYGDAVECELGSMSVTDLPDGRSACSASCALCGATGHTVHTTEPTP